MESINDLENIGDIIETNLVSHGERRIATGLAISDETRQKIEEFHAQVARALDLSLQAIGQRNETAARHVVSMSRDISRLSSEASKHGAARLIADEPNRVEAYSVEMDIFADLKRIYYFAARLARMQLPEGDGARHPRLTMVG